MAKFSDECGARDDASRNSKPEESCTSQYTSPLTRGLTGNLRVMGSVLTVLRETLDGHSDDHDHGTTRDRPSSSEYIIDNWNKSQRENGSKRICNSDETFQGTLRVIEVCFSISKGWHIGNRLRAYTHPKMRQSEGHDQLRIESRDKLNAHACWK